jgi:uncharacterized protein (TIGR03118 family)
MALACATGLLPATRPAWAAQVAYVQTNLVASSPAYAPHILEPTLLNGWGIAIRPAGFGGHFWVTINGGGTSLEYVGDVGGVPLFQDELKVVTVPGPAGPLGTPTGVVFNPASHFVITQDHPNGPITGPARFLFVTDSGTLSAWTERQNGSTFDRPGEAALQVDRSTLGSQFFGLGIGPASDRLYVADFGVDPGIRVYTPSFTESTSGFANPFASGPGQTFQVGDYTPFNVQTPGSSVFVAYAKSQEDPGNPGHIFPGEEEPAPGQGRLAEFDAAGALLRVWDDLGGLNAPWGLAIAPSNFGPFSSYLLVSNFGDGTIAAFDPITHAFAGHLRDPAGQVIVIDGIWGLQFGNGASLGEAHFLYFAAGPNEETDGIFGRLAAVPIPEPGTAALLLAGLGILGVLMHSRSAVSRSHHGA